MAAPLPDVPGAGRAAEPAGGGPRGSPRPPPRPPGGDPPPAPPDRRKKDDNILEIPSIPNPFPELCCSPFASVLSASLLPKATSRKKQVIKVYSEDDTSRALEVPSDITARDVCQLLILKNHYIDDHSWTLFEQLTNTGLGHLSESLTSGTESSYTVLFYLDNSTHSSETTSEWAVSIFLQYNQFGWIYGELWDRAT